MVFIALGQYVYPTADDFCMAAGVRDEGLFRHLWQHYLDWSGRYTGNSLYALYPLIFGMYEGYAWIPLLIITLLLLATAFLLSTLFRISLAERSVWLVSLVIICAFLLGLRHHASSLYWMASSLTYLTAHILLLFILAYMLRVYDLQRQQQAITQPFLILSLLVVLGAGTNEIYMLFQSALIGSVFLYFWFNQRVLSKPWFILLLVSLLGFAVVYFSPGNTLRESTFPLKHDWMRSVNGSLEMGSWSLKVWLSNPVFILSSLLTPFAVARLSVSSSRVFVVSKRFLLMLVALTLAIPFVLQFPAWWSMGGWPPPRTVDAIYFVFFTAWFLLLGAASLRFMPKGWVYSKQNNIQTRAGLVLLLLTLLFGIAVPVNSRFYQAWQDLTYRAKPFNKYMMQRLALIEKSIQQGVYYVNVPAPPADIPRSIYFNDIRSDWRDWRNVCYADYFGLKGIQRVGQPWNQDVHPQGGVEKR